MFQDKFEEQERRIQEMRKECMLSMNNSTSPSNKMLFEDVYGCPKIWDGIMCWPDAAAGTLMELPCPKFIVGFDPTRWASKFCTVESEWYVSPVTNHPWSNYTQCFSAPTTKITLQYPSLGNDTLLADFIPLVKYVSTVGYTFSLVTLLVAFFVFVLLKRLWSPHNKLHMHLFASFILRAFITLLKNSLFVKGIGLPSNFVIKDEESFFDHDSKMSWQCKFIVSLWQYSVMSNYSWILMEGLYLYSRIFYALSNAASVTMFVVLGWGLPVLFVGSWVMARIFLEDTFCWTTNENPALFQLIKAPITASTLINLIVFINILSVLYKLNQTRRLSYWKWTKSTLVLVPLFGVHYTAYLVMSYFGLQGRVELIWLFVDQLFTSLQGFFVAMLFGIFNCEVQLEFERIYRGQYDNMALTSHSQLET